MTRIGDYSQGWPPELVSHLETQLEADAATSDLQQSVLDKDRHTPPSNPTVGDRYIVATSATGAWSGRVGFITEYRTEGDQETDAWAFTPPADGMIVWVDDESLLYTYTGAEWVSNPATRETVRFFVSGAISTGLEQGGVWEAPAAGVITRVMVYRKTTAGTSSSTIVDVNVSDTTIFTNQANRPAIAFNDTDRRVTTTTIDFGVFSLGDLITVDVDQIDAGGSPSNLSVVLNVVYGIAAISSRHILDGVFVTESVGPSVEKGLSDAVVAVSTTVTELEYERLPAETLVAAETLFAEMDYVRPLAEAAVAITSSVGPSVEKGLADAAVVGDAVASEWAFTRAPSETAVVSDTVARLLTT